MTGRLVSTRADAVGGALLWETAGLRCTLVRRPAQQSFEVTVKRGSDVVKRLAFEQEEDAVAFAVGEMRQKASLSVKLSNKAHA